MLCNVLYIFLDNQLIHMHHGLRNNAKSGGK